MKKDSYWWKAGTKAPILIDNIGYTLYIIEVELLRFEVEFYEKDNGEQPARDFLLSLDKKMRAKMTDMIKILEDNGYKLREPYSKALSDGIFELRTKLGSDVSRVMYFFYVDQQIVLTNGFIKKTQRTPRAEIEKAKKYREDYLRRKEKK